MDHIMILSFVYIAIVVIVLFGLCIFIHELGHFAAAKALGMVIDVFSIGFGPEILKWKGKSETEYVISLFPLGGFVKPAGEQISEVEDAKPKPGDYLAAPLKSRILIVCAGVVMNYLLAFVLFTVIFMMGRPIPGTTIGDFVEDYPAAVSDLEVKDKIVAVNGKAVASWKELTDAFKTAPEGSLSLGIERAGTPDILTIPVLPKTEPISDMFGKVHQVRRIGIVPHPEANKFERYGFIGALIQSAKVETYLTIMTHKAMFYLVTGRLSMDAISGPVGIISMTGDAAKLGLPYLLQLMATLSVSLAVLNLLPVPALDGGHLVFLILEGIRRKPVSLKIQERFTQVGFSLLLLLMVFLIYNDLDNIHLFDKIKGLVTGN